MNLAAKRMLSLSRRMSGSIQVNLTFTGPRMGASPACLMHRRTTSWFSRLTFAPARAFARHMPT